MLVTSINTENKVWFFSSYLKANRVVFLAETSNKKRIEGEGVN